MDSADQSDPINRIDSQERQQQRLLFDNDSKEGASSRLQSEDQQVSALNESIAALLQGASRQLPIEEQQYSDPNESTAMPLQEGASSRLQGEEQQVSSPNESIAALLQGASSQLPIEEQQYSDPNESTARPLQGSSQAAAALDIDLEDVILTETLRENLQKVTDKHHPSDEVPGRRQHGQNLHFEEHFSDAPGKRGPKTTAAKGSDRAFIVQKLLEYITKIEGIAIKTMDFYINLLVNNGAEEMQQQVNNDLSSWKNVQLEIAIAGESGSGKSSFINAVLGLTADDEGAAAVGCNETTMEVTKYVHPERQNIAFYDLPGVGTPKYPKNNYFELVNIDKYDFFLLLSQQRFKENDMWFANEIEKRNKKFFFVRTHIHKDMLANKWSHPRTHDRRKVIKEIRDNIRKHLLDGGIHLENVYIALIDNHQTHDYDFEELLYKLVENAPEMKREALVYSLFEHSRGILQMKADFLKGRMWRIALTASIRSLTSRENREEVMKLMFHECSLYQQQLGIDTASLGTIALQLEVDKDEIIKEIKMSSYTEHDLETIFSKEWNPVNVLIRLTPIVGRIASAIRAYKNCVACLKNMLELCEKDALALNAYLKTKMALCRM